MKRVTKDELANALFKTTAALQIAIQGARYPEALEKRTGL